MRIDLAQVSAIQPDLGSTGQTEQAPRKTEARVQVQTTTEHNTEPSKAAKPSPLPEPKQLSVSVDDKRNVIYRFTDPNNGEVVRQVPPEEILRIMRNIEDLLQESEQKLKITL